MEEHFRNMFDMPLADFPSKKENPLGSVAILEYTINLPDRFDKSIDTYEKIRIKMLSGIGYIDKDIHYYEQCKSGAYHIHGCLYIKRGLYSIEGLIRSLTETILKSIDGRLRLNWEKNFFHFYQRYRTPIVTVQYEDSIDRILHWEQYIRKNAL